MNGLGRYEEAPPRPGGDRVHAELFVAAWALAELIEAASRTGNAEQARDALARLGEQTETAKPTGRSACSPSRAHC